MIKAALCVNRAAAASPTFEFQGKLVGVVEGEHLLVRGLVVGVEEEFRGEHEDRKTSFHQLRLPSVLLHWHGLSLSLSLCSSTRSRRSGL